MQKIYREAFVVTILLILYSVIPQTSIAQSFLTDSVIAEKFHNFRKAYPNQLLFVHTDKTLYTNNETIWFSAYLASESDKELLKKHTTLTSVLIREETREIIAKPNFLMSSGLGFGSITLPNNVPPGNYQLICSTNLLDKSGHPLALFSQPLTFKNTIQNTFKSTLEWVDTIPNNGFLRARVTAKPVSTDPKAKFAGTASIGNSFKKEFLLTQQEPARLIDIPVDILKSNSALSTTITYNNEQQYLRAVLPGNSNSGLNIRFFPEGGSLVNRLDNVVAWEALTLTGQPVSLAAILLQDNVAIDTIQTNYYGIGKFNLRPNDGKLYSVKIKMNDYLKADSIIYLPKAINDGIVLRLDHAVVNDTLRMQVFGDQQPVQVIINTNSRALATFRLNTNPKGVQASIALPAMNKGIGSITVIDALGRPLSERLFFAHYDQVVNAEINLGKDEFRKKEKVVVKIKLADETGKPVPGVVSVAAVQQNRIEADKVQDIALHTYLVSSIGKIPGKVFGNPLKDRQILEDILLVKGWREYTWQKLINISSDDSIITTIPDLKGKVTLSGKPLKKPIDIVLMKDSLLELLTTRSDGSFTLNEDQLRVAYNGNVVASLNQSNKNGYTIEMEQVFSKTINLVVGNIENHNTIGPSMRITNSTDGQLLGLNQSIGLQEVIVTTSKVDNSLYRSELKMGNNPCGDFVCPSGFLNCPNHVGYPTNRHPIKGKQYETLTLNVDGSQRRSIIFYSGCVIEEKKDVFILPPIYTAKVFYGVCDGFESLTMPQYISTLLWKPGVVTNEEGLTQFDFYTGDITGSFKIIIQGIGPEGVISGEKEFTVK